MRGLAQPVEIRGVAVATPEQSALPSDGAPNKVIGVICSGDVAVHRDEVKSALERGLAQRPDAVWVCIEPKSDRMTHDVMLSLDIDPVVLPLCPAWQAKDDEHGYDMRRQWRDGEMLHLCDELIVFHKRTGNSPWRDRKKWGEANGGLNANLFVVELGTAPKAKARGKTRKPVGA